MLNYLRNSSRLSSLLMVCVLWLSLQPAVNAAMVSTDQLVAEQQSTLERAALLAALDRADVRQALISNGVEPEQARLRISTMTDDEVAILNRNLDQLPAGGTLGSIISAALVVFIVLLVTDILGYTDVFPFVKKHHNPR